MLYSKATLLQGVCMVSTKEGAHGATMHSIGHIIRARRREIGLTAQALANAVGCTRSYLSQIENDRRNTPPSEKLLRQFESNLRMERDTLVRVRRWEASSEELRNEMLELKTDQHLAKRIARILQLKGVDALHRSGELKKLADRLSDEPAPANVGERVTMGGLVPLVNKMMAGSFNEFTDLGYPARVADEYISVPGVSDPDAFAARVHGDSMEPAYKQDDIVVFSPLTQVRDGSDCFVRLERDEESTFKRVYFEGDPEAEPHIRLQPLNNRYPSMTARREDISAMFPAVYVIRSVGGSTPGT